MAFLNKKEDVIDLQLTQYGKYLLSQGKLKPVYYAFFDDDVIYDQRYASGSALETQKDIQGRIIDNSLSVETQYLYHSVDTIAIQNQLKNLRSSDEIDKIQQTPERHYALSDPLGNSEFASSKAPSLNIRIENGMITSSAATITGSGKKDYAIKSIPQLNLSDVVFVTFVDDVETDDPNDRPEIVFNFEDGTYINVEKDHLLLTIIEENTPLSRENFDIEVYVLDQTGNIDHPLYFKKQNEIMKNGLLVDPVERERHPFHQDEVSPGQIPPADLYAIDEVEYYFDLKVDGEIFNRGE
tara:strand:- start:176 stop:1066 length:891 start_codon:yes stop_codon:yes gene_type:complete